MLYLLLGDSEVYNIAAYAKYPLRLNSIIKDSWDTPYTYFQLLIWYNNRTFDKSNNGVPYVMQYHKNVIGCLDRHKYCICKRVYILFLDVI